MLKLVQIDNGVFDLVFDDPALNDAEAAIQTLVYAVLFTDQEAPDSRVPDRYERRGWWADPAAGTGIWHVRRQPLSQSARREAIFRVEQALIDHGLSDVSVTEDPAGAGNVSGVFLRISGLHNGRTFTLSVPL
ncbi:phage GP46 family protein [Methylomonas rapida]|uniref:Phage GP46 family protein n=1 Tax=Methylomonas rapida TaxID=2963939 RepID=A0ABY7GIC9_9GAMM|nr:phage GP46 family protein [Methylomonas rapida]WAR43593.1 phage GP46 family protein [Methylomonas rapida]WAR45464.1 phage GP46 family protein [Methylomonas rapida]